MPVRTGTPETRISSMPQAGSIYGQLSSIQSYSLNSHKNAIPLLLLSGFQMQGLNYSK